MRINKVINGEGPPVTVRMLYHGVKEFTLVDKLISKRCVSILSHLSALQ